MSVMKRETKKILKNALNQHNNSDLATIFPKLPKLMRKTKQNIPHSEEPI